MKTRKQDKPEDLWATDPVTKERVRGFLVLLKDRKGKVIKLPCQDDPNYTGQQALNVMQEYARRRPLVPARAFTNSLYGGPEVLTLKEMEWLFT